jgi:hypothetical protein
MIKTHFLSFIVLMISLPVAGQEDFVVTQKGDTLKGRVSFQQMGKIEQILIKGEKRQTLTAIQARMASLKGKVYRPVQFSATVQMMEVMMDGYLSLMAFRPPNLMSYDGRLLLMRDGRMAEVPNIGFKKFVSSFLSDYQELSSQIKDGDLDRNDLEKIVSEYNVFIDKQTMAGRQRSSVSQKQKSKLEILDDLQAEVEQSNIASKKDVLDMLTEIREKIKGNKSIPPYLSNSLKEHLKSNPQLVNKLEGIFSTL